MVVGERERVTMEKKFGLVQWHRIRYTEGRLLSYDFGVTRDSSSNADAMVLASPRLRGIHPPDNIQNGGRPGGNAAQTRTG
jgi:hypothetical protein